MKSAVFGITLLASFLSFVPVRAILSGSGKITPQDYIGLPADALKTNPPACGMPYATLDLSRITAVQALDSKADCNKCIKVVNTKNKKFIYALAVDLGGAGLDLSIPSFKELFGQQYDASPATWSETDYSNCAGIYSKGGNSSSSSKVSTTPNKSTSHARVTSKTSSHLRPTTTKIKSSIHTRPTSTKTKSSGHGRPTTSIKTKAPGHGRHTTTKTKSASRGHPTATKSKRPGHRCSSRKNKNKHHPKKASTAGRRKQQKKHQH
ncbi:hypothetical protein BCR42DRAFT_409977 [Absidia repens]|uniref:Cerato-platanin-domain-containing protein n=1 Tax=Absidia repens TaxID=90262 RepID=A0A1X2INC5_9FUNG|nr:hypothetical protein BCR42DRAFT_409977 [Absidia repens]